MLVISMEAMAFTKFFTYDFECYTIFSASVFQVKMKYLCFYNIGGKFSARNRLDIKITQIWINCIGKKLIRHIRKLVYSDCRSSWWKATSSGWDMSRDDNMSTFDFTWRKTKTVISFKEMFVFVNGSNFFVFLNLIHSS